MTTRPTTQDGPAAQQDIREIETLFAELITAFDEHDAVAFDSRFTDDVVFTAVNGMRFTNWADLHAYHHALSASEVLIERRQDVVDRAEGDRRGREG